MRSRSPVSFMQLVTLQKMSACFALSRQRKVHLKSESRMTILVFLQGKKQDTTNRRVAMIRQVITLVLVSEGALRPACHL